MSILVRKPPEAMVSMSHTWGPPVPPEIASSFLAEPRELEAEPVEAYLEPHLRCILDDIYEFTDKYAKNGDVCLAGGFVARVAGRVNTYNDVDLWCKNSDIYYALRKKIKADAVFQHDKKGYGFTVTHFTFNGLDCDLIGPATVIKENIASIVKEFDINWSMFAIDLQNERLVYDPEAFNPKLMFSNRILSHKAPHLQITIDRVKKYLTRLTGEYDKIEAEKLLTWLNTRIGAI